MMTRCKAGGGPEYGGVYLMMNVVTRDFYIGSSYDVRERWMSHINQMSKCRHPLTMVNVLAMRHGVDSFRFLLIEGGMTHILDQNRLKVEHRYINRLRPTLNQKARKRRRSDPRISTVETVAKVLGCKIDDLMRK